MIVTVTGHRRFDKLDLPIIQTAVREHLLGADVVYMGGASGIDVTVLAILDALREGRTPRTITVVPCTLAEQPKDVRALLTCSDELVELSVPITARDGYQAYHVRNRYMIDRSTHVLAFHDGRESGGTWSAMHYARKQGKTLIVVGLRPT